MGLLGFSAGTAEAIFALEYLPASVQVDTVVLLGTSISRDYDLTEAQIRASLLLATPLLMALLTMGPLAVRVLYAGGFERSVPDRGYRQRRGQALGEGDADPQAGERARADGNGDPGQVGDCRIDLLGVGHSFADTHVQDDLVQLGDLHLVGVAELFLQRGTDARAIFGLQPRLVSLINH